ncbi:shikimate dehydrogenase [Xylophilus sp. Leaf220]|uniref:shikimate dehydrogenase n=1 Tax=Xylophilus sp. Leaf220 TaxID=1735686 RepID=UPI00070093A8|nr:shikimate dehydrogenase [Xylophilus sp. Leaf220]
MSADVIPSESRAVTAGSTPDRYCVVGNPVAHSRSPWIHAAFARLTGESIEYDRLLVPLDGFVDGLRTFAASGGKGCNVTVPFKFEAAGFAHRLTDRALLAGAANTLRFETDGIHADNTDGAGLVADIERNAVVPLAGSTLLLVGAGGASAGALGPLVAAAPARLVVVNRTPARAEALVARHAAWARASGTVLEAVPIAELNESFDIVVNATSSSLEGGGIPVPPLVLRPGTLALDMMYGPASRPFLSWAQRYGAAPRDGLGMLVEQAAEAFRFWRGVQPPTQDVLAALRAEMA